jgi:hypothetical protein
MPWWDLGAFELLRWAPDDPGFGQDHALETSGLAAGGGFLYAAVESYARLLQIDPERLTARVVAVDVPRFSELEGIAVRGSTAYLCDEAHAAVYRVDLVDHLAIASGLAEGPLSARPLTLEGVSVPGGKIGFEGVALSTDGETLYLLLERSVAEEGGCVSTIFSMRVTADSLVAFGAPLEVPLEDCAWRLAGLEPWSGGLLALKTQYPGERYQVIFLDPATGAWRVVLELTELLRSVRSAGWGNNVEGIAVTDDGSLYLVGDNAVTMLVDLEEPPPTAELAIFLRIPPTYRVLGERGREQLESPP